MQATEKTREGRTLYARHDKTTDALAAINQSQAKVEKLGDDLATFNRQDVIITVSGYSNVKGNIGVNMHKLLTYALIKFTEQYSKAQNGNNYTVEFHIDEYIQIVSGKRQQTRHEMQKRMRRELLLLQAIRVTATSENQFESISLISRTAARNGIITIEFSRPFAEYLLKKPKTVIHSQLMKISGRSPTAYAIGLKLTEHYYMNAKNRPKAAGKLRVKSILKCTPLPSYESVLEEGRSWKDRIKKPFENAMNELKATGVLKNWKYEPEAEAHNYHAFAETFAAFRIAGNNDYKKRG